MDDADVATRRARVSEQLRLLAESGAPHGCFPAAFGGRDDHGGNVAAFEELVTADPSLQVKSGVQWGLFGCAVLHLGTAAHHERWLPGIMDLSIPGVFAMTETGHGSDVAALGTTATYDPEAEEFVIHTPSRAAWKDYLGNAAVDGIAAVVFAQLITGGENHGVHAFYVPIRDGSGAFLPGVGGEDDGVKGGLNGVDNGRLHFTDVRIPRGNLLNRYGDVAADGVYSSPIASKGRRFFTMLGTLIQGRVGLEGAATWASALGLTIAIRYGAERRQFASTPEGEEVVLLDYPRHQRRLLTRLATTYAQAFAHDLSLQGFDRVFGGTDVTDTERQDLETRAAALKPLSTWHALDTLQECREACGGAGFLAENRFTGLRQDLDIYTTFEGDNTVLLQLVGKRLVTDRARALKGKTPLGLAQTVAAHAARSAVRRAGLSRVRGPLTGEPGSAAAQRRLLAGRVEQLTSELTARLRPAAKLPPEEAAALAQGCQNLLLDAARAHAELLQWEAFTSAVDAIPDAETRAVLGEVRDLFALGLIERHLGWYLLAKRLSPSCARQVPESIDRLCARLRPHTLDLVEAFGFDQAHLRAPIASGAEQRRQDEARTAVVPEPAYAA
ncbi:MAG: acyl-CoA dehydrogenase [Propionicimonas sp.]|nr:acyl-CoA dehydrogenase [Propionicimonas sp.]